MHPIPADISSTRRESTKKNKESALQYSSLQNTDETKRLSVKRIAMGSGLTNKSLSCTTSNDSTKGRSYPLDGLGKSSPGFFHVSLYFQR